MTHPSAFKPHLVSTNCPPSNEEAENKVFHVPSLKEQLQESADCVLDGAFSGVTPGIRNAIMEELFNAIIEVVDPPKDHAFEAADGVRYYVQRIGKHQWNVFREEIDEYGKIWSQFPVDDVDDCDTRGQAIESYKARIQHNIDVENQNEKDNSKN